MPKSTCVIPSPANGGGSGRGLGSGGDSQGVVGAETLGLGRGVSGSPSAGLVKEKALSEVWYWA